jgi:soluble lytic murein transglycosylase
MRSRALPLALLFCLGCARPGSPSSSSSAPALAASVAAGPGSAEPADSSASLDAPMTPGPWRDSLRLGKLKEAAAQLDALAEAERKRPDIRLVRARVAARLGDHKTAVEQLEGVELTALGDMIPRLRAESALEAGPYEVAAAYYGAKAGIKHLTRAAQALSLAGKPDDARRLLDRALAQGKGGATEAQARALRLKLAEAAGARDVAAIDARWIFLHTPENAHARAASEALARLEPAWSPSQQERLARVEKLAAAGKVEATLAELDALGAGASGGKKKGKGLDELELLRARGNALYKLRRYAEAAAVLGRVSHAKGGTLDDTFLAARALSRANRDDEAIKAYEELVRRHAKAPQAEEASYLAARLMMLLGRLDDAAVAYGKYLRNHRHPRHRAAALQELGLVQMSLRRYSKARASFGQLAREEDSKAESARLRELEGVAALRAGDEAGAREAFSEVIRSQPLTWPALAARARLEQMKAPVPPLIEPAEAAAPAPLTVQLPPDAAFLHQLGLDDDAEEAMRPHERELAASFGPRGHEALCSAYSQLDPAGRRYRIGQDHVKVDMVMKAPGGATRWGWDCLYPRPYEDMVREAESRQSLPNGLVYAIMRQESSFDPDVVSPALAVGLLQLLPTTARELSARASLPFEEGSLVSPVVNIDLGARYLSMLSRMWKGNLPLAIASYNAGPGAVSRWLEHAGPTEIDLWVARIPYGETRHYVARVMGNLARYAFLAGGTEAVPRLALEVDTGMRAEKGAF